MLPKGTEILLTHKPLKGPSGGGKVIRYLGKSLCRVGGIYDDCSIKAGYAVGISLESRSEFFELVSELDDIILAGYLLKKTTGRRNTCRELRKSLGRVGGIYNGRRIDSGNTCSIGTERWSEFLELLSECRDIILAGYLLKKTTGRPEYLSRTPKEP